MRIALGVEYDGSDFFGWQIQKDGRSVQGCIESALSAVANHPVRVVCAGRTDTGVHALGQVIHFDTESTRPERAWTLGVNSELPPDVSVRWAQVVPDDFHARFSARARNYSYLIFNSPVRSALLQNRMWWVRRRLDVEAMSDAAAVLVGKHDFSSFRAAGCQANTATRHVSRLAIHRLDDEIVQMDITANAFLHHMVRNIIGTLAVIGRGEECSEWLSEVLMARDRCESGVTAPPAGLYLVRVDYESLLIQPRSPSLTMMAPGPSDKAETTDNPDDLE